MHKTLELVIEAMSEDYRNGGTFDEVGFSNFFPEEDSEAVRQAWCDYRAVRREDPDHPQSVEDLIAYYAIQS